MIEVYPKKFDPERAAYQLEKLALAILGNAKDQLKAEKRAAKSAPTQEKSPLTVPLTLNSKTR